MLDLRTKALIARSVGIVAIALGFVSGIYGLEHTETMWLRSVWRSGPHQGARGRNGGKP